MSHERGRGRGRGRGAFGPRPANSFGRGGHGTPLANTNLNAGGEGQRGHPGQHAQEAGSELKYPVQNYLPPRDAVHQTRLPPRTGLIRPGPMTRDSATCLHCGGSFDFCPRQCQWCPDSHSGRAYPRLYLSRAWWKKHGPGMRVPDGQQICPSPPEVAILRRLGHNFVDDLPGVDMPNTGERNPKRPKAEPDASAAADWQARLSLTDEVARLTKRLADTQEQLLHALSRERSMQAEIDELKGSLYVSLSLSRHFAPGESGRGLQSWSESEPGDG
ncbi:hypothetical protein NX059_010137 [Plenodomus lindquistii]|nr:hypothetical protein NX059_010137 [Plenodomus lindquistii]